jgi:hypothetical protein
MARQLPPHGCLRFDVKAEVFLNGSKIGEGGTDQDWDILTSARSGRASTGCVADPRQGESFRREAEVFV